MSFLHYFGILHAATLACFVFVSTAAAAPLWQQVDVLRNGEGGLTSIDGVYDFAFSPEGDYA